MKRTLALIGVVAATLAGCGGGSHKPTTLNLAGHVTVKDVSFGIHKSCASRWRGDSDDITLGTQVVIKDASGTIVGTTSLRQGTLIGAGSFLDSACVYPYGVTVPVSTYLPSAGQHPQPGHGHPGGSHPRRGGP